MARASFGNTTDNLFAEGVVSAIDAGYEEILVLATTHPFMNAVINFVITERPPEKAVRQPNWLRYANGQTVRFVAEGKAMRGLIADRVLIHPLASVQARQAVIPCERPNPRKLT